MSFHGLLTRTVLVATVLIATACSAAPTPAPPSPTPFPPPAEAGWPSSPPEEQGMDPLRLGQMLDTIEQLDLPVDGVVVARHGQLVFEAYPNRAYGPNDKHLLYSVTKSVTSALIGIAIDQGLIASVDQKVLDFFPETPVANVDARKQNLTVEHLLTMSAGFEWQGPDDLLHSWGAALQSNNPVRHVLDLPMASEPGTQWVYNGGCSHLLSAILTKASGDSTLALARQHLFDPLGISDVRWPRDPQGIYFGGQDIWLRPRDMAKFGQLYLNGGSWNAEQIIPAEWVARSVETHLSQWEGGYGYQWWTYPQSGIYYAAGAYEQRIYVVPKLDMVVVFAADNRAPDLNTGEMREGAPMVDWLLGRFILPACSEYAEARYSGFGFSFDHPLVMLPSEVLPSSDASGHVQLRFGGSPFDMIGVQWDTQASPSVLQAAVDGFFAFVQSEGLQVNDRGAWIPATKDDHPMLYQRATITQQLRFASAVGAWYCEQAKRVYVVYYATIPELATQQDPLAELQRFVGSFVCH